MENFSFLYPKVLYLEILIPIFWLLYIFLRHKHIKNLKKFANPHILSEIVEEYPRGKITFKYILITTAAALLIIALARPQYSSYTIEQTSTNAEIAILLDISNSMMVKDQGEEYTRLDKAKNAIYRFLNQLHQEKISLIIFAGTAAIQIPLTTDYKAFKIILQSINPSFISAQGTALAEAIKLGLLSFSSNPKKIKTIILLSDGEDHEGNIDEAIQKAKNEGIKIYTVGIGSPRGNVIYLNNKLLLDNNGNPVISKLNEKILRKIALQTGGKYFHLGYNMNALVKIYKEIQKQASKQKNKIKKQEDKFHYFAFPALILLFLEFFILERTNRWLARFDIFKPQKKF